MEKLSLLVVDDEPGIRSGVKRILRNFSVDFSFMEAGLFFEVTEAATGEEAVDLINRNFYDIILLDNKLPGIQGIEVLEYIKDKKYKSLVIMITSYASLDVAVKATSAGAHDFMPKPFTPQELKSAMENIAKHIFLKRVTRQLNKEGKQVRFQFLSVLSHELKAPINAVEGYLRMIKDKTAGDDVASYTEMIDRSLTRLNGMRNLIMDLLDLTKIESGAKKQEKKPTDLVFIAQTAMDTMMPYAIQRDVKVHLSAPESLIIIVDPDEMEIIFNNLVSNAIKYNRDHGRDDITMKKENSMITVDVKDTGIGISEADIQKLFNEFVRIKNSKTKSITGSGLGLSIVKKLVQSYNGTVDVTSQPDVGSCFSFTLPITNPLA